MYHYVRDLERSRYPRIRARQTKDFRSQLDYLGKHYTVVAAEDVIGAARGEQELPPNAVWLTFDDGYLDHFTTVFPLLEERGWQGSFFAPACSIRDGKLLDVNKIHFILAASPHPQVIIDEIKRFLQGAREADVSFETMWAAEARASRLDSGEVMFIKRILQNALPVNVRRPLLDHLFQKFVSVDESAVACETYMSLDQIKLMVRSGMYFGSHGYEHVWMDRLSPNEQGREVRLSLDFLTSVGADIGNWIMCYPHGAYNASLLNILARNNCAIGITIRRSIADLASDLPLELPRLDTNDLPIADNALADVG